MTELETELVYALKCVLDSPLKHDERGHAYLHIPARSIVDLPALIRGLINKAEGKS